MRMQRAEAFIIEDPYRIPENATIAELRKQTAANGVHSMLVIDAEGR
jgi:hypothetical protein